MNLVFLDTETDSKDSPVVLQLGAIIVSRDGKEVSSIDEMFNIGVIKIGVEAMSVHHITPEMVANKSPFIGSAAWQKLQEYNNEGNYLVAHNAPFDVGALKNSGFDNKMTVIDTYRCAQHLFPDYDSYKLQCIRYALGLYRKEEDEIEKLGIGINSTVAHSALPDSLYVKMFFDYMLKHVEGDFAKLVKLTTEIVLLKYMPLGKYSKFKMNNPPTIEQLATKDPSYLRYMKGLSNISEELLYTIKYYMKRG